MISCVDAQLLIKNIDICSRRSQIAPAVKEISNIQMLLDNLIPKRLNIRTDYKAAQIKIR